jgi:protocatechuate 3,4-dioxygenase beta subunit
MVQDRQSSVSRRALLGMGLSGALLAACQRAAGSGPGACAAPAPAPAPLPPFAPSAQLLPTPAADDGDDMPPHAAVCAPTADNIEGPFFKAGAPYRSVLAAAGEAGEHLTLTGAVLGTHCRPLSGVEIDIWQADARGQYDLDGFRYRGRLHTQDDGAFELATIVPGRYLNGRRYRPAHIHVKLRAPGHRPLTTQLYFAGDPYNGGDDFIRPSLILTPRRMGAVTVARFDFVLVASPG